MRILTFGWDFPPLKNGGLGIACMGLTSELSHLGEDIVFVLPRTQSVDSSNRFIFADVENIKLRGILSPLIPYTSSRSRLYRTLPDGTTSMYSHNLIEEVYRYASKAALIAKEEEFDLIHAHDWTSYLAGLAAREVSGRPLILHVHATSFDQAGGQSVDPEIYKIEKHAFEGADGIIAISRYTKNIIVEMHGVDPEKIYVVHNGCFESEYSKLEPVLKNLKEQGKKIVLYHGRITIQKGPDYFVRAARRVVDVDPDVIFVISGWGDLEAQVMDQVASYGLSKNVIFAGALWDEERDRMYQAADLVVMPSVSEPFGLIPFESIAHGTPALISKQSGVSEVLTHVLKVDFWDIEEMANKILAAVRYRSMNDQLVTLGRLELKQLSWKRAAEKVVEVYKKVLELFHRENK